MCARMLDGIANLRAEFDHRLVHLRFDLLFEHDFSALENLMNMRTQFARLWINDRELLFNAESECVFFGAHWWIGFSEDDGYWWGRESPPKPPGCHPKERKAAVPDSVATLPAWRMAAIQPEAACRPGQAGSLSSEHA